MKVQAKWIILILLAINFQLLAQQDLEINFVKKEFEVPPGKVFNLAFFANNQTGDSLSLKPIFGLPDNWKMVTSQGAVGVHSFQKKFFILSVQVPGLYPVGKYPLTVQFFDTQNKKLLVTDSILVVIQEIEKIAIKKLEQSSYVFSGDTIRAVYLLNNQGNTTKNFFLETQNCDVKGSVEVSLKAGESVSVVVEKPTSEEYIASAREFLTLRVKVANRVLESVNTWSQVFPSKKYKKDMYFRFPVSFSGSYLAVNKDDNFESTYQFQLFGQGALDLEGKHQLEFLARGPNNTDLSYLGLYDQYYLSYKNQNMLLFAGQKNFMFTPLTESSRYGLGAESQFLLNNGIKFGILYVEPRFYEEIKNEVAGTLGYQFNKKNEIDLFYVSKQFSSISNRTQLFSIVSKFSPFSGTNIDGEFSRGYFEGEADNAYRLNFSSRFSIFNFSGNYYNTGEKYPGYYNNTKFYSGNISARISQRLGVSFYAKRDFVNAQLDTFFVTAPYTKSYQSSIDYKLGEQSHLKLYLREYERKDRLSANKFHYKTRSANTRFTQKWRRFRYSLTAEVGRTTNYLLDPGENEQNSFRGMGDFSYRLGTKHTIRTFGSWSNINEFVSGNQQNVTAGLSISSQLGKNFYANFYVQNAYDIDDYYKNRNLMQLNLNYDFMKNHSIALRSFYTLFQTKLEDAEFTVSATYEYKFGVPLKRVMKTGVIQGVVSNADDEPLEGILVKLLNKTTVTDKNGTFEFDFVQTGKHLLSIDESSFKLNEITNIPNPLEVNVFEDQKTTVDVRILKGARLEGIIKLEETKLKATQDKSLKAENIIVEIQSAFEEYRIVTDKNGRFSFPLIRPGKVNFKVYASSIPKAYKLTQAEYEYLLEAGQEKYIEIGLVNKKNNIIFKPAGSLSLKKSMGLSKTKKTEIAKTERVDSEELFYSIQVGAFSKKLDENDMFLSGDLFFFEKEIDNLHKYFVGHYVTRELAEAALRKLKSRYANSFIVVIQNEKVYGVHQFERSRNKK